ncbi:MAG TPA: tyrosine-type recombinase/integrase [Actinomycetota bacterium]|nr:tyrosine-type recombinase/integrase [Actinomycetota bacterium]HKN89304.1 tyrosine-type recombinase/integrase [Acidimicrobiia bacterium]
MTGHSDKQSASAMVHAVRHTFATRMAEDGATATEIQALLGNEAQSTSRGYIEAPATQARQAARAHRTYQTLGPLSLLSTRP